MFANLLKSYHDNIRQKMKAASEGSFLVTNWHGAEKGLQAHKQGGILL